MALHSLYCGDVPLRNCSLTHSVPPHTGCAVTYYVILELTTCSHSLHVCNDGLHEISPLFENFIACNAQRSYALLASEACVVNYCPCICLTHSVYIVKCTDMLC